MRDNEQIRRRRVCVRCGGRFTSHERVEDRAEAQRIAGAVEYLASLADKNLPFSSD